MGISNARYNVFSKKIIDNIFYIGGKDFGCPLQIQKVNPSSLAERCGMQANDYIVKIGQAQLLAPDQ